MSQPINILIVEDQLVFIQALKLVFGTSPKIGEVDHALTYDECFEKLSWKSYEVIFLDLNFDKEYTGVDIARKIKIDYPESKIIILTERVKTEDYEQLVNEIKVHGYLDKKLDIQSLHLAIDAVMAGETFVDEDVKKMVDIEEMMKFSQHEKDILLHLGNGLTQKETGGKVFLSEKSIQYHLAKMVARTNSSNTVELIRKYSDYTLANRQIKSWPPKYEKTD